MEEATNTPFTYEVVEHIGVLCEDKNGFRKEINVVSYNGNEPVIDIRNWTPDGNPSRGVTLNKDSFMKLLTIVKDKFLIEEEEK